MVFEPAQLSEVRAGVSFRVSGKFTQPLEGRWTCYLCPQATEQDLQSLVFFREINENLLVETP